MFVRKIRFLPGVVAVVLVMNLPHSVFASINMITETWESQAQTDPFTGTGDQSWTGDVGAYAIRTATWPVSPAQDFAGIRSLRSANHGSLPGAPVVETIVTDITSVVDLSVQMVWNVFFSGNRVTIQPSRRGDLILLSDNSDVGSLENPADDTNAFKLTLWDPYANATSNVPSSSHEGAAVADALALWSVDSTDDRWRLMGWIPLASTQNLRDGWNLRVVRSTTGVWSIGFANGAIGQVPALTTIGADPFDVSVFSGSVYAGVGWTARNNTTNDYTDFGFDQFSVQAVPEASSLVVWALLFSLAGYRFANRKRATA